MPLDPSAFYAAAPTRPFRWVGAMFASGDGRPRSPALQLFAGRVTIKRNKTIKSNGGEALREGRPCARSDYRRDHARGRGLSAGTIMRADLEALSLNYDGAQIGREPKESHAA